MLNWLRNRTHRFVAATAGLGGIGLLCMMVGGVLLNAAIVVAAVYLGLMITIFRLPDTVDPQWSFLKRLILRPIIWVRNFLFNNSLILTIGLGITTGWMVGLTSVTGIAAMALSALGGDLIVQAFKDGTALLKEHAILA